MRSLRIGGQLCFLGLKLSEPAPNYLTFLLCLSNNLAYGGVDLLHQVKKCHVVARVYFLQGLHDGGVFLDELLQTFHMRGVPQRTLCPQGNIQELSIELGRTFRSQRSLPREPLALELLLVQS